LQTGPPVEEFLRAGDLFDKSLLDPLSRVDARFGRSGVDLTLHAQSAKSSPLTSQQ